MKPELPPASHVIVMCEPETLVGAHPSDKRLTDNGRRSVRLAAEQMYGAGHHPGPLLAGATDAGRESLQIMAGILHVDPEDLYYSSELQGASTDVLEVEIRVLALQYTLVTLVAPNPGVSELARILSRNAAAPSLQHAQWVYLPWPPPY